MNPSSNHQRRKRKQQRNILGLSLQHLLSVRSLVLCFTFLTFVYLLSHTNPFASSSFHPVLVVSSLSLLSSYSYSSTAEPVKDFGTSLPPLEIENRVIFPDHVLLLVAGGFNDIGLLMKNRGFSHELECVYFSKDQNESSDFSVQRYLSVDEYEQFKFFIRCPLPMSLNYSADANLRWAGVNNRIFLGGVYEKNKSSCSWENVVYEAALDSTTTIVVFVKGLNLRANRLSDPSLFTCHFRVRKSDMNGNSYNLISTTALTAAQEVVRCPLPRVIQTNPQNFEEIRVTVGYLQSGRENPILLPSVAKVFDQMPQRKNIREKKYNLCMCTMVWNQGSAIREWITYHSWLGVERWFVYDNNSDDELDRVIQELDHENYNVTRHVWPWIKTQEAGFSHCALRARDECNWVGFMDVDEYFYFPYSAHRQKKARKLNYVGRNSLNALVSNLSRNVGEIRTSCYSFGPSGQDKHPMQGVTIGYTCRLLNAERHKSIVRVDALDPSLLNVVHHFRLKKGFEYLNLPQSVGIINHYKYQVWEVFRAKFYRRVGTYVADWRENQNEGSRDRTPGLGTEAVEPPDWARRFCEVWDTGLRDFVLSNMVDFSTGLLPWEGKYD
ncbi:hypothetical protein STAS_08352 [Striga asiatica]|uniref:Glycosyltransferase family 92 protein n=1 Tax=Striga asiatica TaxID=4170 RepID=A0A5A7PHZ3_STRAF|nr:hypothetical protein STAS_08352 [Striga asiatica]